MQATAVFNPNPNQTGSIAAQAVQYGVPVNSAIQQAGFQATGAGPDPTGTCIAKCKASNPIDAVAEASCANNCIASSGTSNLPLQNLSDLPGAVVQAILSPVESFVQNAFPKVGLFLLALILTIVGVWLLVKQ